MRLLYLWLQTLLQFAFSKRFTPRACRTHFVSRPFPAPTPTPAQLWDTATGEATKSYVGHSAPVHCVIFAKDGARIVSASRDHTLKVGQRCPDTPLSLPSSWGCADRDKAYRNTTISTTPSAFLMPDETGWKCTQMVHVFCSLFFKGKGKEIVLQPTSETAGSGCLSASGFRATGVGYGDQGGPPHPHRPHQHHLLLRRLQQFDPLLLLRRQPEGIPSHTPNPRLFHGNPTQVLVHMWTTS